MNINWKHLSYAMFVSFVVIWICALVVSVLFIQPLLDMWKNLPQILTGLENHTLTIVIAESGLPSIPIWILLIISLLLWAVMTIIFYVIMNYFKKNKRVESPSDV